MKLEIAIVEKTFYPKGKQEGNWILMDANQQNLGRMATQIASYLMGKHKPSYTPGVDGGDFVVVINARQVGVHPTRLTEKIYYRHSGYPGGLKSINLRDQLLKHPDRVIRAAVWGMLPHNKLGRRLIKKLKIYPEDSHPHGGQNPQPVTSEANVKVEGAGK
jgi:large subunit ribosomal protein L13